MTRDEIISLGVTPSLARAISDYLKTNIPRPPRFADPTALVNNEGAMNGWINAADAIGALAVAEPKPDENPAEMYSEPATRK